MNITLETYTFDPVMAIEEAASICYDSKPSQEGKILNHCLESGHSSVAEFSDFTFKIEGVSRALLAQLTRHRHASFAVRSQRYCYEAGNNYIIPNSILSNSLSLIEYQKTMEIISDAYDKLIYLGIPKEDARYVLPNSQPTTLEMKINLRSLINFCNLRLCTRAQWEIRELALKIKNEILNKIDIPLYGSAKISNYLVPKCQSFSVPYCPESRGCGKYKTLKNLIEGGNK